MVAWAALIASSSLWHQTIATQPIACNTSAQWMLYRAGGMAGPRPLRPLRPLLLVLLVLLVIAAPLGYTPGFGHYGAGLFELEMSVRVELVETSRSASTGSA